MPEYVPQIQKKLQKIIGEAIISSPELKVKELPEIKIEVPREKSHGDFASNIAMVLAAQAKMNPRKIAEIIKAKLGHAELIAKVEVAGPGFINFFLNKQWLYDVLVEIYQKGENFGQVNLGNQEKVQIEFVSANPTGPLHVGHSRGAVVGDVLASILVEAGYDVSKEYYINDAGNQMNLLGKSVAIRYLQLLGQDIALPEDAYQGTYLKEIAQEIYKEHGEAYLEKAEKGDYYFFQEYAYAKLLKKIKEDLSLFGIEFDSWYSERKLHQGRIAKAIAELEDKGFIYEKEGAVWFKSSSFGDDKDRVVKKADGSLTYLAADIAYHQDKFARGFSRLINVWGADHHGYIKRMKASVEALGYNPDNLEVILVQMVTLLREGKQVPMSKRAGEFVTLRDVVNEVGKDAARYFYIMRSTDSHLDFDLELAKKQSSDNPVYYIQYSHARICSILKQLKSAGITIPELSEVNLSLLNDESELMLLKNMAAYPGEIARSAQTRSPHLLANYAFNLAAAFHKFYNSCQIIGAEEELMKARIILVLAAKQVIVNVLKVLGISAPESM